MIDWSDLLNHSEHRPYPLPDRAWHMTMSWLDLLFAHWSFPAEVIRDLLPPNIPLDTYEGRAWVGVVPFLLSGFATRPDAERWFQSDRIHPLAKAHPLMLDALWPELRKLL